MGRAYYGPAFFGELIQIVAELRQMKYRDQDIKKQIRKLIRYLVKLPVINGGGFCGFFPNMCGDEVMVRKTSWSVLPILILISFSGFYLRYESVIETIVDRPLRADAGQYFMYAYNLRHKHTYSGEIGDPGDLGSSVAPDAFRSPGYPLFLMPFVDGLPNKKMIERILISQAIISALTLIVAFLFFQGFLPVFWGAIASLLVALSPHLIVTNSYILTETLFCFLIVLFGWLISLFVIKPFFGLGIMIGSITGIACLVRPSLQYFPIIMTFFLVFHFGWRKGLHYLAFMFIGFAVVFAPWIARNIVTLKIATDKRQMITFLRHGMYPNFTFDDVTESYGFPYRYDPRSKEIGKDVPSILKEISRRFHQETLKHTKWFLLGKPVAFWSWDIIQGFGDAFVYPVLKSPYFYNRYFQWTHFLMYVFHWSSVVLSLFGCLMAWFPLSMIGLTKESICVARFASLLLTYYTLVHMVGVPLPRYSVPLRPFLYGMALFTPHLLISCIRKHRGFQKFIGDTTLHPPIFPTWKKHKIPQENS